MSNIHFGEPMKNYTSFKVGGEAEFFAEPENLDELKKVLDFFKKYKIPYLVIGNGTNLLVSDKGISGGVIKIGEAFSGIEFEGNLAMGGGGMLLSTFVRLSSKEGLSGGEFAGGIPGTLGGAIAMNAGAYGGEMKDIVRWAEVLDEGKILRLDNEQLKFAYRESIIEKNKYIVLRVCVELKQGVQEEIDAKMAELSYKRKSKQPIHLPSAGSTFKRPEGFFAAKLIEDAGLKGFTIGGAQVSEMHAGFVVNIGGATAEDIYRLICHVQKTVYEKSGIRLNTEVKILGDFENCY